MTQKMSTKLSSVVLFVRLRPSGKHCKPWYRICKLEIPGPMHNAQTARTIATCKGIALKGVAQPAESNGHCIGITQVVGVE